ncbi:putative membrane protein [Ehrlichia cf. muris str. EmCRT]|uniref:Putative membrane protein n=1 Tax=Ehrlichia cf. muris str. EmCRT TaxID=1359167 RepID=A0A0F3N8X3_9RICK|nr:putative membrane protein [Ehrlichia cf. muris str. EmCRT]
MSVVKVGFISGFYIIAKVLVLRLVFIFNERKYKLLLIFCSSK